MNPTHPLIRVCLTPDADETMIPTQAYEGDAGYDLKANIEEPVIIPPLGRATIPTGVCVEIPPEFKGEVRPRSGLTEKGLYAMLGTIDSGYRGEIKVFFVNLSSVPQTIFPRIQNIAQLVISPVVYPHYLPVTELSPSQRGTRGFGSSDEKQKGGKQDA